MSNTKGAAGTFVALLSIVVFVALLVAGWVWFKSDRADPQTISNFQECAAAGYQVAESYPRQCRMPDGRVFVEEVEPGSGPGYSEYSSEKGEVVRIKSPLAEQTVQSPMTITGEVKGSWSFEADFPIELVNANGKTVATGHGTLDGDWMTEEYVPFQAQLEFSEPSTDTGTLILKRANPSGLPENADSVKIPVRFTKSSI